MAHIATVANGLKHAARRGTGIVGLAKHGSPKAALISLYNDTLGVVESMPAGAAYRKNIEILTNNRLKIVSSTEDVDEIESRIGAGQIEQVVLQAEREFELAQKMKEWKPWEELEEQPSADQWKWP
eukprot:m.1637835 g.1637835  ORF g.1637835 m.1637835 type:complete len:126 (-) comp26247_c0_seq1:220-597(-)